MLKISRVAKMAVVGIFLLRLPVQAAPIQWSAPISIGSDLSSLSARSSFGGVAGAVNFGPLEGPPPANNLVDNVAGAQNIPLTSTVGGIDFVAVGTAPANSIATTTATLGRLNSDGPYPGVDPLLDPLLRSNAFVTGAGSSFSVTLQGLIPTNFYEVQLFSVRQNFGGLTRFSSAGGGFVDVTASAFTYVLGGFWADSTTQTFTVAVSPNATAGANNLRAYLSALVLRRRVPEINAVAAFAPLCSIALVFLVWFDRKKSTSVAN